MRVLLCLFLLLVLISAAAEETRLWVAGQQLSPEQLEAELEPLVEAYWWEVSSQGFRKRLLQSPDWRRQMVHSLLLRYPEGPMGDHSAARGNPEFERSLNATIEAAPGELAPRVLMLLHCGEARLETPDACVQRHAGALDQLQPDNALGPLFLAQAALARGDVTASSSWMHEAASRDVFRHGYWAIVKAQFEVFGDAGPLVDDPLNLEEVAKDALAEGMVSHLVQHPVNQLGRKCQQVSDEPMLSGCLATAKAMKLPGTGRLAYKLALAIEERIFERQGNSDALAALALERQSLKRRFQQVQSVQESMYRTGVAAPILDAYVRFGELDTALDHGATASAQENAGEHTQLVLKASTTDRTRCMDLPPRADAPDCVTREMVRAEVERLTDFLGEKMQGRGFRASLAADPSAEAQMLALFMNLPRVDSPSPQRLAVAKTLAARFPEHALANRLAATLCHRDHACLGDTASRLMRYEPDDSLGYLLAAVVHFEQDEQEKALHALEKAVGASRIRSGFGMVAAHGAEVISRHMGPAPENDVLGVWELAPGMVSIGYAAAIAVPTARLPRYCDGQLDRAMYAGCLGAARALQLPGGSLIEVLIGLQLETRLLQAADDPALTGAIDRLARARQLRDDMTSSLDRFGADPVFHHDYLGKLADAGGVAALRWMLTNYEHGGGSTIARAQPPSG